MRERDSCVQFLFLFFSPLSVPIYTYPIPFDSLIHAEKNGKSSERRNKKITSLVRAVRTRTWNKFSNGPTMPNEWMMIMILSFFFHLYFRSPHEPT